MPHATPPDRSSVTVAGIAVPAHLIRAATSPWRGLPKTLRNSLVLAIVMVAAIVGGVAVLLIVISKWSGRG